MQSPERNHNELDPTTQLEPHEVSRYKSGLAVASWLVAGPHGLEQEGFTILNALDKGGLYFVVYDDLSYLTEPIEAVTYDITIPSTTETLGIVYSNNSGQTVEFVYNQGEEHATLYGLATYKEIEPRDLSKFPGEEVIKQLNSWVTNSEAINRTTQAEHKITNIPDKAWGRFMSQM